MYAIRKDQFSSKHILNRCSSLGLGITILQFTWGIYNIAQLQNDEENSFLTEDDAEGVLNCEPGGKEDEIEKNDDGLRIICAKANSAYNLDELRKYMVIGVILYTQVFVSLLDVYLYTILRSATQKENLCSCWLGLCLQVALLTYNMIEILIVAYNGVFDGSSMLLAARATVRAVSIEMICLFLHEIEDKQETDVFLYIVLNV